MLNYSVEHLKKTTSNMVGCYWLQWAGELRDLGGVILLKNTVTTAAEEMF